MNDEECIRQENRVDQYKKMKLRILKLENKKYFCDGKVLENIEVDIKELKEELEEI
ncbi:hypothetical protein [Clostridium gasigenes]|uniref:Uncharacterized protein n=1 Tax=Clostridium gasigenes TaxID=94869 RepID=A0A7X0SH24_9CLOT|nr:hypothetical protein [Clostridium gasigenes]MBB6716228.1 hypothetical protein [Clostridium gasigenes]